MAVCKLTGGVSCTYSGEDVKFIFMVLSPRGLPQNHLKALSEISRFIMNEENRGLLAGAHNTEELREVFFQDDA